MNWKVAPEACVVSLICWNFCVLFFWYEFATFKSPSCGSQNKTSQPHPSVTLADYIETDVISVLLVPLLRSKREHWAELYTSLRFMRTSKTQKVSSKLRMYRVWSKSPYCNEDGQSVSRQSTPSVNECLDWTHLTPLLYIWHIVLCSAGQAVGVYDKYEMSPGIVKEYLKRYIWHQ